MAELASGSDGLDMRCWTKPRGIVNLTNQLIHALHFSPISMPPKPSCPHTVTFVAPHVRHFAPCGPGVVQKRLKLMMLHDTRTCPTVSGATTGVLRRVEHVDGRVNRCRPDEFPAPPRPGSSVSRHTHPVLTPPAITPSMLLCLPLDACYAQALAMRGKRAGSRFSSALTKRWSSSLLSCAYAGSSQRLCRSSGSSRRSKSSP